MYNFKGKEQIRPLEQLVLIYETQIVEQGSPDYINALAELIKERYQDSGITDFDPSEALDANDNRNISQYYEEFESKILAIINAYEKGEKWIVKRGTIKSFRN